MDAQVIALNGTIVTILGMAVLYLCLLSSHWSVLCGEKFYECCERKGSALPYFRRVSALSMDGTVCVCELLPSHDPICVPDEFISTPSNVTHSVELYDWEEQEYCCKWSEVCVCYGVLTICQNNPVGTSVD